MPGGNPNEGHSVYHKAMSSIGGIYLDPAAYGITKGVLQTVMEKRHWLLSRNYPQPFTADIRWFESMGVLMNPGDMLCGIQAMKVCDYCGGAEPTDFKRCKSCGANQ